MARKKEFDEAAILDKAVDLFWRNGYHATSAQQLVEALGISRSSLYDTYTDKRTLFLKALKQYQDRYETALIQYANQATDAEQGVRGIFSGLLQECAVDELNKGCFMVNTSIELSALDPEIGQLVAENKRNVEDALTRLVKKGQDAGQLNTRKTARAFGRFLFGTITALRVAARSRTDKKVLQDIVDVTLSALK